MASPSSSVATLRPDLARSLEQFDLAMDRQGFIGLQLCPVIEAQKAGGNWGKIPLEQLLQTRETRRAPDGSYSRGKYTFDPNNVFVTTEHGAEEPVDDNEATMYSSYFDQELVCTERAYDAVLRNQEIRIAGLLTDTGVFTGSQAVTASTYWTDHDNSTPMDDVLAWKHQVWRNCGLWPTVLAIHKLLFDHLRRNSQMIEQLKFNGIQDVTPSKINAAMIAQALDVEQVLVAGSPKNLANSAQTRSLATIWPQDKVLLGRTSQTEDPREPCVARTFHWDEDGSTIGGTVETYREEKIRGDVVRVRHQVGEQLYYKECAVLATGLWQSGVEGF